MFLCLAFLFAGSCLAAAPGFPPLTGRVVDQAHLLSPQAAQQLAGDLATQEAKTGQQVVVAIVSSLQGQTIEDYGYKLGRFWGIGQKDKDTGAILLVAPNEHKVRIEVGYGLEGTLTDAKSSDIIDEIILPDFKAGRMQAGVTDGAAAMLRVLNGQPVEASSATDPEYPVYEAPARPVHSGSSHSPALLGNGLFLFLIIIFLFMRVGGFFWLPFGLLGGQSWGTGSGFSGGSGGFSGGGGSFGGGGASGSW